MQNDIISLVSKTYGRDAHGYVTTTRTEREVFAEVRSVGMREKYEALQAGLNPELTFVLADYYDYKNEDEVIYQDEYYRVLRTYRDGLRLEIVVTRDASLEPDPEPEPEPTPEPTPEPDPEQDPEEEP